FFFFSSRRRHTRSKRDWSSDVCSSDLIGIYAVRPRICLVEGTTGYDPSLDSVDVAVPVKSDPACGRSRKKCAGRDSDKSAGCVSITSCHIGQRTLDSLRWQGHGYEPGEANGG